MRAVIQRVSSASVSISGNRCGEIGNGLVLFLGIESEDSHEDVKWLSKKISQLRIFSDENGLMNKSIMQVGGKVLLISQFTLFAKTQKGNRPSFIKAAKPEVAIPLYQDFIRQIADDTNTKIQTGKFGADMQIQLCNDGPVTILIDTKNKE